MKTLQLSPIPLAEGPTATSGRRTLIAKVTFELAADGGVVLARTQQPMQAAQGVRPSGECWYAGDFAGHKPQLDVTVVGHAKAAAASRQIAIGITVGGMVLSLVARAAQPATKIPLWQEHLLDPSDGRSARLAPLLRPGGNAHVASPRLPGLVGDEWLRLDGLLQGHEQWRGQLPGLQPFVYLVSERALTQPGRHVELRASTLWLDVDQCRCVISWRGELPEHRYVVDPLLVCSLGKTTQPPLWSQLQQRIGDHLHAVAHEPSPQEPMAPSRPSGPATGTLMMDDIRAALEGAASGKEEAIEAAPETPRAGVRLGSQGGVQLGHVVLSNSEHAPEQALPFGPGDAGSKQRDIVTTPIPQQLAELSHGQTMPISGPSERPDTPFHKEVSAGAAAFMQLGSDGASADMSMVKASETINFSGEIAKATLPFEADKGALRPGTLRPGTLRPDTLRPDTMRPRRKFSGTADLSSFRRDSATPFDAPKKQPAVAPSVTPVGAGPPQTLVGMPLARQPNPPMAPPPQMMGPPQTLIGMPLAQQPAAQSPAALSPPPRQASAPVKPAAPEPVPVAVYATIKAASWATPTELEQLLTQHDITVERWRLHERHQASAIADEAAAGKTDLADELRRAITEARNGSSALAASSPLWDVDAYVALQIDLEDCDEQQPILTEHGLDASGWRAAQRHWGHRARSDKSFAKTLRKKLAAARRCRDAL